MTLGFRGGEKMKRETKNTKEDPDMTFLDLLDQVEKIGAYNAKLRFLNLFIRDDDK